MSDQGVKTLPSGVTLQQSDPRIHVHEWADQFTDTMDPILVHFQLLVMEEGKCIYVWMGNVRPAVSCHANLSIAMQSNYVSSHAHELLIIKP